MPNDAKLGLVAGVAIVVLIAALFFRRDAPAEPTLPSALPPRSAASSAPATFSNPPVDKDLPPLPPLPELPPTAAP